MSVAARERFATRLKEASILSRRFIDVRNGEKGTRTTGHQQPENWLEADDDGLSGNYGVHPGHGLIEFDVDDYDDEHDTDALDALPETFTVASPHTDDEAPGHRYYAVEDDAEAREVLEETVGTLNPDMSWGEVKYDGKYVVGPGSQLDGCGKEWCDECAKPGGGYYRIAEDRPIATITADDLADVLRADQKNDVDEENDEREIDTSRPASEQFELDDEEDIDADHEDKEEWLTEADIREALKHIDPAVGNDKWVRIGYALGGFFDDATATELYEKWSQGKLADEHSGSEWDAEAERRAPDMIDRSDPATDDTDASIATVVELAKRGGWDLSTCPSAEAGRAKRLGLDSNSDGSEVVETVASDDPGTFTSPTLEAVEDEDGGVTAIGTSENGSEVRALQLGTFECIACNTIITTGVAATGICEPEGCPACERSGPFQHLGFDGDTDAGIIPRLNALLDPPWYTPSEVDGTRINEVWGDIREFIRDHWDAGEETEYLYDGLTAYAITTWLRPDLDFLPHLMLMGRFTGGKTRLLNTLARVSYRAVVSASATPSSMFRLIDAKDVTFFVSEYHGLDPDTRRELDAIVRAAQKRGEVITRSEAKTDAGGYDVGVYDPFTHVAIATQYEPDDDIISRCVQVHTTRNTRSMPATLDEDRATDIRNRLLGIRLRYLSSDEFEDAERAAYGYLAQRDIEGRPREKLLAIVTVAEMFDKLDVIEPFVDKLVELTEQAESNSEDALFIEAVRDVAFREVGNTVHAESEDPFANIEVPLKDVTERYNDVTGQERSPSWTGQLRARHGFDSKRKSDGTVIADENLGDKLKRLCESYDLGFESLEAHSPITEMAQQDQHRGKCSECGHNEWLDYKDTDAGHYMCSRCASELRDAA